MEKAASNPESEFDFVDAREIQTKVEAIPNGDDGDMIFVNRDISPCTWIQTDTVFSLGDWE